MHIDKKQRIVNYTLHLPNRTWWLLYHYPQFSDKQNSLIKVYDSSYESIFIADILEGTPKITDSISRVSEERSKELDEYYTEATID